MIIIPNEQSAIVRPQLAVVAETCPASRSCRTSQHRQDRPRPPTQGGTYLSAKTLNSRRRITSPGIEMISDVQRQSR